MAEAPAPETGPPRRSRYKRQIIVDAIKADWGKQWSAKPMAPGWRSESSDWTQKDGGVIYLDQMADAVLKALDRHGYILVKVSTNA